MEEYALSRRLFVRASALMLASAALPAGRADDAIAAGTALAEELLAAMGGREAWAGVRYVHVEAVHDDLAVRDPFTNRIWNDLTAFRARFEARNDRMDRRHAVDGDTGWRWREGEVHPLTPEQVAGQRRWWESNVYRTLHRIAVRDPALSFRAPGPRRLEILRADGTRLNWFILNQRGEPMVFGTGDSEAGSVFGPLSSNGTIRYPRWGGRPDGDFRYEIVRLETAAAVPDGVSFTAP